MSSSTPLTGYQKVLLGLLALLQFTVLLDFMVLAPLGNVLMKSLRIGPASFSLVVSAYAFSAGMSGLLAAGFADRFDRKRLLLFFYAGFTLGTLGCALADRYALLLLARVVAGLFGGVIGAIVLTIVADEFDEQQRGQAMGLVQLSFAACQVVGVPLSLWLSSRWNWHAPFTLLVALALLVGAGVVWWLRPLRRHLTLQVHANPLAHLGHILRRPAYQSGLLTMLLLTVGGGLLSPFGSAFLVHNVRLPPAQLPPLYLLTGLSSLLVVPLVGRLSDRMSRAKLFAAGSVLAAGAVLAYTHLGPAPFWLATLLNVLLFSGIVSRVVPAMALNTSLPAPADRGAYLSVTSSVQQLAGGLAAVAAGQLVTQPTPTSPLLHFPALGYATAAAFVGCIPLVYYVNQTVRRKPKQDPPAVALEGVATTLAE